LGISVIEKERRTWEESEAEELQKERSEVCLIYMIFWELAVL
jgi:hypothetical protein